MDARGSATYRHVRHRRKSLMELFAAELHAAFKS